MTEDDRFNLLVEFSQKLLKDKTVWKALRILEDKNIIDSVRIKSDCIVPFYELMSITRQTEYKNKYGDEPIAT